MAFGPEGDPIPPAAFAAAAAGQPDIEIVCGAMGRCAQARSSRSSRRRPRPAELGAWGSRRRRALDPGDARPRSAAGGRVRGRTGRRAARLRAHRLWPRADDHHTLGSLLPDCRGLAGASDGGRSRLSLDDGQTVSVGDLVARLRGRHQQGRSPPAQPVGRAAPSSGCPTAPSRAPGTPCCCSCRRSASCGSRSSGAQPGRGHG